VTDRFDSLLIDLDGTLIDSAGASVEALAAVDEWACVEWGTKPNGIRSVASGILDELWREAPFAAQFRDLGFASTDALWVDFDGDGQMLSQIREWLPGFRSQFWQTVSQRLGARSAPLVDELTLRFPEERYNRLRPFPDVDSALRDLASRFQLMIVSNGPGDVQRLKLERANLEQFFTSLLISGDIAVAKPDPRIFHHALRLAASNAQRALMIGDDWRNDVLGARWVGIDAVFVASSVASKGELRGRERINGVPVIASFAELPMLLRQL
jgi:putative hydrolase of the HAD superfamily